MRPAVKYTLGRIGLFLAVVLALWPINLNIFLKLMLAVIFSAALSFFLLRGWRDEMAQQLAGAAARRRAEKERLRAALAGDDQSTAAPVSPAGPVSSEPPSDPGSESGTDPESGQPPR